MASFLAVVTVSGLTLIQLRLYRLYVKSQSNGGVARSIATMPFPWLVQVLLIGKART